MGNDMRTSSISMVWWWLVKHKQVSHWRRHHHLEVQEQIVILTIRIILIICIRQEHQVRNIHQYQDHHRHHLHHHLHHIIVGLITDILHQRSIRNLLFFIHDNAKNSFKRNICVHRNNFRLSYCFTRIGTYFVTYPKQIT